MLLFKILRPAEWAELKRAGQTAGAPVDLADGYVHLSTAEQVEGTLRKHFANEGDLVLLACSEPAMAADLRWEAARGGALFPHLYRPLRMADVVWSRDLPAGEQGHELGALE